MFSILGLKERLHSYVPYPEKLLMEINNQSSSFHRYSEQLQGDLDACVDLSYTAHLRLLTVQMTLRAWMFLLREIQQDQSLPMDIVKRISFFCERAHKQSKAIDQVLEQDMFVRSKAHMQYNVPTQDKFVHKAVPFLIKARKAFETHRTHIASLRKGLFKKPNNVSHSYKQHGLLCTYIPKAYASLHKAQERVRKWVARDLPFIKSGASKVMPFHYELIKDFDHIQAAAMWEIQSITFMLNRHQSFMRLDPVQTTLPDHWVAWLDDPKVLSLLVQKEVVAWRKYVNTLYTYNNSIAMSETKRSRENTSFQGKYTSSQGKYFFMSEAMEYVRGWLQALKRLEQQECFQSCNAGKEIEKTRIKGQELLTSLEKVVQQNVDTTSPYW